MKVLYISNRLNSTDGSAVHGRQFVKALRELEHDVRTYPEMVELAASRKEKNPGGASLGQKLRRINLRTFDAALKKFVPYYVDLSNLVEGYVKSRNSAKQVMRLVAQFKPEIIVYRAVMYDFIPNLIRRRVKQVMIAELNSIKSLEMTISTSKNPTWIRRQVEAWTYEPADAITVVSEEIGRHLRGLGVSKPITVVSNGVDVEQFKPDQKEKSRLKEKYGITGKVTLGYIGSYQRWHGLDDSLRVLRHLVDKGYAVHFVVIGSGAEEGSFKEILHELELDAYVTQIPSLQHDQITRYINIIDIAVMTYPPIENFYFSPLKMYEYLANGIPVVSSSLGQIAQVLSTGDKGLLAPPGDAEAFAAITEKLLDDPALREKIGENARVWVCDKCTWKDNARTVLSAAKV